MLMGKNIISQSEIGVFIALFKYALWLFVSANRARHARETAARGTAVRHGVCHP